MPNSTLRESLTAFAVEVTDRKPAASWPFGLVLLGQRHCGGGTESNRTGSRTLIHQSM